MLQDIEGLEKDVVLHIFTTGMRAGKRNIKNEMNNSQHRGPDDKKMAANFLRTIGEDATLIFMSLNSFIICN